MAVASLTEANNSGGFVAVWRFNVALAVLIAACGAEASPPLALQPIEGAERTIDVSVTEFQFQLSTIEFQPGENVGFRIRNEGVVSHDFRVTTVAALEEYQSSARATPVQEEEALERLDSQSTSVKVGPGATEDLLVKFDASDPYDVLVCLIPGHFEAGMRADLTVSK